MTTSDIFPKCTVLPATKYHAEVDYIIHWPNGTSSPVKVFNSEDRATTVNCPVFG